MNAIKRLLLATVAIATAKHPPKHMGRLHRASSAHREREESLWSIQTRAFRHSSVPNALSTPLYDVFPTGLARHNKSPLRHKIVEVTLQQRCPSLTVLKVFLLEFFDIFCCRFGFRVKTLYPTRATGRQAPGSRCCYYRDPFHLKQQRSTTRPPPLWTPPTAFIQHI